MADAYASTGVTSIVYYVTLTFFDSNMKNLFVAIILDQFDRQSNDKLEDEDMFAIAMDRLKNGGHEALKLDDLTDKLNQLHIDEAKKKRIRAETTRPWRKEHSTQWGRMQWLSGRR